MHCREAVMGIMLPCSHGEVLIKKKITKIYAL